MENIAKSIAKNITIGLISSSLILGTGTAQKPQKIFSKKQTQVETNNKQELPIRIKIGQYDPEVRIMARPLCTVQKKYAYAIKEQLEKELK